MNGLDLTLNFRLVLQTKIQNLNRAHLIDKNSRSLIPIRISKSGSRLNKIPKRVISLDHQYYRTLTKVSILVMIWITWSSRGRYSRINYIRLKISHRVSMMVIGHLIVICLSSLLNVRRFTMFIIEKSLIYQIKISKNFHYNDVDDRLRRSVIVMLVTSF